MTVANSIYGFSFIFRIAWEIWMFTTDTKILKQLQCQSCMNCENGYAYLIFFQHFFGFLLPLTAIFILQLVTMSLKKTSKEGLVVSFMKSSTIGGTTSTSDRNSIYMNSDSAFFDLRKTRSLESRENVGSMRFQTGQALLAAQQKTYIEVADDSLFDDIVSPRHTNSVV